VAHLVVTFDVSERRACRVTGQQRSTQRYRPQHSKEEERLVSDVRRLAGLQPRYGQRRIHALLRREGWRVNKKRVGRVWREERLQVPVRKRKRRRLGHSANSCQRRPATTRNEVWSYDFVFDRTDDGRRLKFLTVVDEFTREALAVHVARHMTAQDVIDVLTGLMAERGAPKHIRSDNGPEFIAKAIVKWLGELEVGTLFIAPGSPWENAYGESFNGRLEDELLGSEIFATLAEARWLAETWRREYNTARPHSSLGYKTPAEFAASCVASNSAPLRSKRRRTLQPQRLS
jgi:transposase InsO family protein